MRRVQHGAFTSHVLATELDGLEPQAKAFCTDVVYGTLRHHMYIDACLKPHLKRPDKLPEDVRSALRAASYELLIRQTARHAVVNEWVAVLKRKFGKLAGLVNAVLRKVERVETEAALTHSVPDWLFSDWQSLFGKEKALEVASGMLEPEPLWLTAYHAHAKDLLVDEGCEVTDGPLPETFAVKLSRPLPTLKAYKRGWVQPQNPSSTFVGRLLAPQTGERVLDLASGNGVKAAQLAAAGAKVVSVEIEPRKLEGAAQNLQRLGLTVEHQLQDLTKASSLEPAAKVLLDAPCSGTGTLRGHPEIKLRLMPDDLTALATLQSSLLENAAKLTAPEGLLVYAICALTLKESKRVTETFLANHPNFQLEPLETALPQHSTPWGSYLLPLHGLDGFFIAQLRRV